MVEICHSTFLSNLQPLNEIVQTQNFASSTGAALATVQSRHGVILKETLKQETSNVKPETLNL